MSPLIFTLFAVAAVAAIVYGYHAHKKRQEEMFLLATELGLQFDPSPGEVHHRFEGFTPFGRGDAKESSNLLHGGFNGVDWEIFEYSYQTGSGKDRHTHRYQILSAGLPVSLPRLEVRPEGWWDKVAGLVGFEDINFESEAFSRRFHVKCDSRKVAYDIIHPQMIEYLMSIDPVHWQVRGTRIVLISSGKCSPARIKAFMGMAEGFIRRIPGYVREDRGLQSDEGVRR